jgi:polyhydroxybutyrate depolymerase
MAVSAFGGFVKEKLAVGICSFAVPRRESPMESPRQYMDLADSLLVGDIRRTYLVHSPDDSDPHSLLLAFHGGGGRAKGMPLLTRFNEIADREGFVVAYPDGYRRHWADTPGTSPNGVDDLSFVSAIIEKLTTTYRIDTAKVYAAGISNGGFFSQRVAIEFPEKISAVATVAATMQASLAETKVLSKPVSVLLIHGTNDSLVPFDGGRVKAGARREILSAHNSAIKWAALNGCHFTPSILALPTRIQDATRVRVEKFLQCRGNAEVILYVIEGGGHTWPGGWQYLPEGIIGRTSRNIDASEEIVAFFKRH